MVKARRQLFSLIDPSLQYKFLALVLLYGMAVVVFLGMTLFVPDILDMMNENLSLEVRAAAAGRVLGLHSWVWPAIIALVCLLGIHSVWIFHRFIGPLYRFRSAFAEMSRGRLDFRVRLRKRDYLHREEVAINEMMEVFAEKWESVRVSSLDALKSLGALEQVISRASDWADRERQLLKDHREQLEAIANNARYFHLTEKEKAEQGMVEHTNGFFGEDSA